MNLKKEITYFDGPGPQNTEVTILLAKKRALDLGIKHVVVASSTGKTGLLVAEAFKDCSVNIVVVTYHCGFKEEERWQMSNSKLIRLNEIGAEVVTQSHVFACLERSITRKFGGVSHSEAIAESFRRLLGPGIKVCVEIAIMAADSGQIPCGQNVEVIAIAGAGSGADSSIIVRPAHMNNFFDLEIREIICMPRKKKY